MINVRTGSIAGFGLLAALTVAALVNDGSGGFQAAITHNLTSLQIWVDLVIAVVIWCVWLLWDARETGRNPWPWIIAALIVGCFSPLLYAIVYQRWPASQIVSHQDQNAPAGWRRGMAGLVLVLFTGLTAMALIVDGTDVAATVTRTWSNIQIWFDLVIAMVFWMGWMIKDARRAGRNPWGWVVFGAVLGSFAPLVYLLMYGRWPASHPST